jgi:hypothetical protein
VLRILDDPELKQQLERDAYEYGRRMAWPRVGEQVMGLFREVAAEERDAARQGIASSSARWLHAALGPPPSVPAAAIALAGNSV